MDQQIDADNTSKTSGQKINCVKNGCFCIVFNNVQKMTIRVLSLIMEYFENFIWYRVVGQAPRGHPWHYITLLRVDIQELNRASDSTVSGYLERQSPEGSPN